MRRESRFVCLSHTDNAVRFIIISYGGAVLTLACSKSMDDSQNVIVCFNWLLALDDKLHFLTGTELLNFTLSRDVK